MLHMKKFLLSLVLMPLMLTAQVNPPPPPNTEDAGGPVAPGYPAPIDNSFFIILLLLMISFFVFLYFKKLKINKTI